MMAGSCSGFQETGADAGGVRLGMLITRLLDDVCGHQQAERGGCPQDSRKCEWLPEVVGKADQFPGPRFMCAGVQALVRVVLCVASLSSGLPMLCMNARCGRWGKLIPRALDNALRQC